MRAILIILILCFVTNFGVTQTDYKKITINKDLELFKISDNAYVHISYGVIEGFGRVPSNGLVYIDNDKAFLFDTPANDSLTKDLVTYIQGTLKAKVIGFAPNHWHVDCMGGLGYLQSIGIESYASYLTIKIAKEKNLPIPAHGFKDSLILKLNDKEIVCRYPGPAHTTDNIIVWLPAEKILFAGCMVKELNSKSLGNTADGNLAEYPKTIKKLMDWYTDVKVVIPGHGRFGDGSLITHTLELATGTGRQ